MVSFITRPKVFIPLIIVVLAVGGYFIFGRGNGTDFEVFEARVLDIIQEVSVTGRVEPIESVDLAFEKSGRIRSVNTRVGDEVRLGAILMSLENGDLYAARDQALADLKAAQATLEQYKKGTRPEELAVTEAKAKSAKSAVGDATSNLIDKISDSYTKSDDAIRNKIDQFFLGPRGPNPQISFITSDSKLETEIETARFALEKELTTWNQSLRTIEADIPTSLLNAKARLALVSDFLDNVALLLSGITPSGSLSQTTIDGYRADVSTARTNINTARTNLTSAEEKFRTADAAFLVAERELDLKKAGKTSEEILAQEAAVLAAEAKARSADAEILKTLIRAPINGIVTEENGNAGETVSANTVMVKLLSASGFKVESFVPEVDIAKVKEGNDASITLDAYGSDITFPARVSQIDPRETIVDGVATYKVTFDFNEKDQRVRAGMTANIDIRTEEKKGVLVVPQRAVKIVNGKKTIEILEADGETTILVEVETGLKGSDGNIEIVSGLTVGDKVVVFAKEE